jgi:hypothetical protein
VIKRLRFRDDAGWRDAIEVAVEVPSEARLVRVAASTVLSSGDDEPPLHLGVIEEWFADEAHLRRFDALNDAGDDSAEGAVVVADPVVLRGAEWLERRWLDPAPRFKHMALAARAPGLTPTEFSARWRDHAGRARGATGTTTIPDDVKGLAYVQDHPLVGDGGDAYDAVNEVYFDDVDALQRRVDWFRDNEIGQTPDELFGATSFLVVREEIQAVHPA